MKAIGVTASFWDGRLSGNPPPHHSSFVFNVFLLENSNKSIGNS